MKLFRGICCTMVVSALSLFPLAPVAAQSAATGGSHGLANWSDSKFATLKIFAKAQHKSWRAINVQLDYLWQDMNDNRDLIAKLQNDGDNTQQATIDFEEDYIQSSTPDLDARIQLANNDMDYGNASSGGDPPHNGRIITAYFNEKGFSPGTVAGIVGNLDYESKLVAGCADVDITAQLDPKSPDVPAIRKYKKAVIANIKSRVNALEKLCLKADGSQALTASHKPTLVAAAGQQIMDIQSLSTQIVPAQTKAELKSLSDAIYKNYRIYSFTKPRQEQLFYADSLAKSSLRLRQAATRKLSKLHGNSPLRIRTRGQLSSVIAASEQVNKTTQEVGDSLAAATPESYTADPKLLVRTQSKLKTARSQFLNARSQFNQIK